MIATLCSGLYVTYVYELIKRNNNYSRETHAQAQSILLLNIKVWSLILYEFTQDLWPFYKTKIKLSHVNKRY